MSFIRIGGYVVAASVGAVALALVYLLLTSPSVDQSKFAYVGDSANGNPVTIQYMGNTNLLVSDGETHLLTDGWFSRFSTWKILTGKIAPDLAAIDWGLEHAGITELDAVIPVHSHFDHAMDAPEVARRTGAMLVGSESTANIGRGWDLPEEQIYVPEDGEVLTFGAFKVTLIKSKHFTFPGGYTSSQAAVGATIDAPLRPPVAWQDYREGGSYSVLVEHPSGSLLLQGSAGFVPNGLDELDVDVLFLGIGGLGSQSADYQNGYWQHVVMATKPDLLVPVHWDSLTHPLGDEPRIANRLWSDVLNFTPRQSLAYVEAQAVASSIPLRHAPFWQEVKLLPLQ